MIFSLYLTSHSYLFYLKLLQVFQEIKTKYAMLGLKLSALKYTSIREKVQLVEISPSCVLHSAQRLSPDLGPIDSSVQLIINKPADSDVVAPDQI